MYILVKIKPLEIFSKVGPVLQVISKAQYNFSSWPASSWPVKTIFALTQTMFGWTKTISHDSITPLSPCKTNVLKKSDTVIFKT